MGTIIVILVFLIVFVYFVGGIKIVQQNKTMVIERFGEYKMILPSGINFIFPFIDKPRDIYWKANSENLLGFQTNTIIKTNVIDLRETVFELPKQSVICKDNVLIDINTAIYFQPDKKNITKLVYGIENMPDALEKLTQTILRNTIASLSLNCLLISREELNIQLARELSIKTDKWGIDVNRVEILDIIIPDDIRDAMDKQMRAERDKNAKVLEAEGEALSIKLVSEAIKNVSNIDPATYILTSKHYQTLQSMGEGNDNKVVYIPGDPNSALSQIATVSELLKK